MPEIFNFTLVIPTPPSTPVVSDGVEAALEEGGFPFADTGQVGVSAAFYPRKFVIDDTTPLVNPGSLLASASMGYSAGPGSLDYTTAALGGSELTNTGDFYVQHFAATDTVIAAQDGNEEITLGTLPNPAAVSHGFLSLPAPFTTDGDFGAVYGFLHERSGVPGTFDLSTFTARGTVNATNGVAPALITNAVWDNDLGVSGSDCRLVNVGFGPPADNSPGTTPFGYLATRGPSSLDPAQEAFFLVRFPGTPGDAAVEIPVILSPTGTLLPDLSRFHVVAREDSTLIFYYKVSDSLSSLQGTAIFAYDPIRGDAGGSFTTTGIKLVPSLLFADYIPAESTSGACLHPVTGEILISLEDTKAASPLQKLSFAVTRGTGRLLDSIKFEIDSTNHPNFFGGRWKDICTTFEARVNSIGWRDNTVGSSFSCVVGYTPGAFSSAHQDFANTIFDPDQIIPLIAEIAVRRDDEVADVGDVEIVGRASTPFAPNETSRQGYDAERDIYTVDSLLKFDNVDLSLIESTIGPPATTTETISAPGVVGPARQFVDPSNSSIVIDGSGTSLDADIGVIVSFWFNPVDDSVLGLRTLVSKLNGVGGTDWRVQWNTITGGIISFEVVTTAGTLVATATNAVSPRAGFWTYITCTFANTEGGFARAKIFAFGALIAEDTGAVASITTSVGTDLVIGYNGITNSPQFSIDDFWFRAFRPTQRDVIALLSQAVSTPNGPAHNSHDPSICDRVVQTAIAPLRSGTTTPELTNEALIVTFREINFQIGPSGYDASIIIDVWSRGQGGTFTYLGSLPSAEGANDFLSSGRTNPRLTINLDIPSRLLFKDVFAGVPRYSLTYATHHADVNKQTIWNILFRLDGLDGLTAQTTKVGNLDITAAAEVLTPGLSVILDSSQLEVVFFATRDTITDVGVIRAIREGDWGADLNTVSGVSLSGLTPDDQFSDLATRAPVSVCGQVVRTVVDGDGVNKTAANTPEDGDFQVFYGAYSRDASLENTLFGTYQIVFDAAQLAATGTLVQRNDGARVDQPGVGLDPFVPIALAEPPPQLSTADPFRHDLIIIANAGARSTNNYQRGRGGLSIYKGRQDGTSWKRIANVSHDPCVSGGGPTHGADLAIIANTILDIDASDYTRTNAKDFYLQISRPGPDGSDRASPIYLTANEALDSRATWEVTTSGSIIPVLHPSFEPFVGVVEDYVVNTRRWEGARTGSQLVKGTFTQAMPAPHWADPSRDAALGVSPSMTNIVPFQGQSFSPKQNIFRGWIQSNLPGAGPSYDAVLPTIFAPNFRTGPGDEPFVLPIDAIDQELDVRPTANEHYRVIGIVDVDLTAAEQATISPQSLITGENGEKAGYGRYIALRVVAGVTTGIVTFDSFYFDDLGTNINATYDPEWREAWAGSFDLPELVVNGMRAVTVSGRTFLYFLFGTSVSSQLFVLELPSITDILATGSTTQDPALVQNLSFVADDRIYAVTLPNNCVVIYVGDAEASPIRNTNAIVHDPLAGKLVRAEKVVVQGQTPFSRSYAATLSRTDYGLEQVLIALEPGQSREGSGGQAYYGTIEPGLGSEIPTDVFDAGTGSIWNLTTLVSDGYTLFDTISVTPDHVKPYFGGFSGTKFGAKTKRRTKPHFLARLTDPRSSTDGVSSTEIYMSAMYSETNHLLRGFGYHINRIVKWGTDADGNPVASFGFGEDAVASESQITFGTSETNVYSTLVPISFNIEYQGGVKDGENFYSNLGGMAGLQMNWELQDDSADRGVPLADVGTDLIPLSFDVIYGAKSLWMSPDVTLVVGWFRGYNIGP